jgi:hypothetical protein
MNIENLVNNLESRKSEVLVTTDVKITENVSILRRN